MDMSWAHDSTTLGKLEKLLTPDHGQVMLLNKC
jgi:hypothetical protein